MRIVTAGVVASLILPGLGCDTDENGGTRVEWGRQNPDTSEPDVREQVICVDWLDASRCCGGISMWHDYGGRCGVDPAGPTWTEYECLLGCAPGTCGDDDNFGFGVDLCLEAYGQRHGQECEFDRDCAYGREEVQDHPEALECGPVGRCVPRTCPYGSRCDTADCSRPPIVELGEPHTVVRLPAGTAVEVSVAGALVVATISDDGRSITESRLLERDTGYDFERFAWSVPARIMDGITLDLDGDGVLELLGRSVDGEGTYAIPLDAEGELSLESLERLPEFWLFLARVPRDGGDAILAQRERELVLVDRDGVVPLFTLDEGWGSHHSGVDYDGDGLEDFWLSEPGPPRTRRAYATSAALEGERSVIVEAQGSVSLSLGETLFITYSDAISCERVAIHTSIRGLAPSRLDAAFVEEQGGIAVPAALRASVLVSTAELNGAPGPEWVVNVQIDGGWWFPPNDILLFEDARPGDGTTATLWDASAHYRIPNDFHARVMPDLDLDGRDELVVVGWGEPGELEVSFHALAPD